MVELWNEKKKHTLKDYENGFQNQSNPNAVRCTVIQPQCILSLQFYRGFACSSLVLTFVHCVALFLQIDISLCPTILCVCVFFLCRGLHSFFCCYFIFYIYFLFGPEQIAIMNYGRSSALLRSMYIGSISLRVRGALVHLWLVSGSAADISCILCIYMCDRLLVSICELFCRPRSCNCFQRSFTALERNYDHIYVYFSTESILYMLFVPYAWRKGKRKKKTLAWKKKTQEKYI